VRIDGLDEVEEMDDTDDMDDADEVRLCAGEYGESKPGL
jgi:hypothetical protein